MKKFPSKLKREFSAGGVVYKRQRGKMVWLVGKHSGYHKWVLPKGLIEKGERGFETAVREVEEEMGVKANLLSERPIHRVQYVYWADFKEQKVKNKEQREKKTQDIEYQQSDEVKSRRRVEKYQESGGRKTKVFKVVSFYLMEYESGDIADHDWEMEEAVWLPFEEAMEKLAFEGEKEALAKAHDTIPNILIS